MQQPILNKIKRVMETAGLRQGQHRILTAVSGGADSVCLLLALKQLDYEVEAVHVEHGIRGRESVDDCSFVRQLCAERGIPFEAVSVDAPALSGEQSLSLEEAARILRWKALGDTAQRLGISVIATAHHQMDQAETVLWNLIRGTSLGGLGGIRPVRREGGRIIVRPLIECGRNQIEDYLRKTGVSWRTDSTNADTRLTRNAIRLKILPLLEELNPGAVTHIARAASDLRLAEDWLQEQTDRYWEEVILEDGDAHGRDLTADREILRQYPETVRSRLILRMIARCSAGRKDISRAHAKAVDLLAAGRSGRRVCLPDHLTAVSEEGVLRLTRRKEEKTQTVIELKTDGRYCFPGACAETGAEYAGSRKGGAVGGSAQTDREDGIVLDVSYCTWPGGEVPKKRYTKYLAYDTMAPCPVLRTRREGDYLIVNSSSGHRKLKDYLIDEKVPRFRRDRIALVAQGHHVLWVIGMRISEGAKVVEGAKAVRIDVSCTSQRG